MHGHMQFRSPSDPDLNDAKATSIASLRRRWWAQMLLGKLMYRGNQCRPLVDMDVDDGDGVAALIH